jgi:hypothetical protein
MKTTEQIISYLEQRKLDLLELREAIAEKFGVNDPIWSEYDGGINEINDVRDFINEVEEESFR